MGEPGVEPCARAELRRVWVWRVPRGGRFLRAARRGPAVGGGGQIMEVADIHTPPKGTLEAMSGSQLSGRLEEQ